MKNNFIRIFFISLFGYFSCTTHKYFDVHDKINSYRFGYLDLNLDSAAIKIYPETNKLYLSIVPQELKKRGIANCSYSEQKLDYFNPDKSLIINLCLNDTIDGLIISRIEFFPRVATQQLYYDAQVETKLFDKNGNLLITTLNNSDSYFENYSNSRYIAKIQKSLIDEGVTGAIKKLIQNMKLSTLYN
jgi:hypothetical protein